MSSSLAGGLLVALASTAALNWAFFRQHGAASALPPLGIRRPLHSLRLLFASGRWLAGFLVGLGGWGLYVLALKLAPLSLVQAVSAGGIGLLALLVERTTDATLSRREWLGVVAAVSGLALLGISLIGRSNAGGGGSWVAVALWVAASLVVAALAAGPLASRLARGAGFGVAAGVLYAGGDVATKAAVGGGTAAAFALAVLACHGLAFVSLQLGFQRGSALATAGVSSLFTNALPILAGMTVFREGLPGGAPGVLRVVAFAAVTAGATALARPDGGSAGAALQTDALASSGAGPDPGRRAWLRRRHAGLQERAAATPARPRAGDAG